jgi:hypothetical protein
VRHGDWLTHGQGSEELGHSNENGLRGRAKQNCAALQVPQRFCKLREGLQVLEAYEMQPEPWNEIIRRAVKGWRGRIACDLLNSACREISVPIIRRLRLRDRRPPRRGPAMALVARGASFQGD